MVKKDKRPGKEPFFSEAFVCCFHVPAPWQDWEYLAMPNSKQQHRIYIYRQETL